MEKKKILKITKNSAKYALSLVTTASLIEVGYLGASMFANDIEATVKLVDQKINPIEYRRRHWWNKPEAFNVRKNQFVADLKKPEKSEEKTTKKTEKKSK